MFQRKRTWKFCQKNSSRCMINIKRISTKNPLYQQERALRNRILLRPIGVPDFGWEMYDSGSWHFVAVNENNVIGCVVLVPLNDQKSKVQLIQMAVDTDFQGKGIGKLLVEDLIGFCKDNSVKEIEIHSRSDVVEFYKLFGFTVFGNAFEEVGILHRYMRMYL